ncbi:sensor histidine kinase [Streptomyces sp. P1-3]|uniref:sensor histidine kinase n=1 Tax=Streptomyces sp. P1-3 TaxID=3421658 RepID=UPI003D3696E9
MGIKGEAEGRGRLLTAVSKVPRALREDLWTTAADPLPRMGQPGWPVWRPVSWLAVVLLAVLFAITSTNQYAFGYHLDLEFSVVLAGVQSAALIVAMSRPLPAWWAGTVSMVVAATSAAVSGTPKGTPFPWAATGIAAQAGVLFMLALRVRPRAAVGALTISVLAGLGCDLFVSRPHDSDTAVAVMVFAAATVVGTALRGRREARTRLVEQETLTAEERARRTLLEERNRIARELHDVVAHHMSVISIQAQVAPHLVENPSEELKENLAGIRENAVEALSELRRVLGVLRSEDALADGVRHAPQPTLDRLDELIGKVRGTGLAVAVETTGERRPLPPGVELSAFRIVQEALSNVMRHAPGASVRVALAYHAAGLTVRIANTAPDRPGAPVRRVQGPDGSGGSGGSGGADNSGGSGHGLLGMRERTAMLGGEFAAGPTPDGGYEVVATLPLELEDDA